MTDEIIWEDPPEGITVGRGRNPVYTELADALRETPGRWAIVKVFENEQQAKSVASQIRTGAYAAFKKGKFETKRKDTKVWARHVPVSE